MSAPPMRHRRGYFHSYMQKFHPEISLDMRATAKREYVDPEAQMHWEGFKRVLAEFREHMQDYANWGGPCVVVKNLPKGAYDFSYRPKIHRNMITALNERDYLQRENPGFRYSVFTLFAPSRPET